MQGSCITCGAPLLRRSDMYCPACQPVAGRFHRSSFCAAGSCAEVAFTGEEWAAFTAGVRAGEFDNVVRRSTM